jgi:hypothetical protein
MLNKSSYPEMGIAEQSIQTIVAPGLRSVKIVSDLTGE